MARRAADSAVPAAVRVSAVALAPGLGEAAAWRHLAAHQGELRRTARVAASRGRIDGVGRRDCILLLRCGRRDCGREMELDESKLTCESCLWMTPNENKCRVHGFRFAVYKCDSCCAITTWDCRSNHYCERCHNQAGSEKNYPCPRYFGGQCPLGARWFD